MFAKLKIKVRMRRKSWRKTKKYVSQHKNMSKNKEQRQGMITLDLPYQPDIFINPMNGVIESFINEEKRR